MLIISFVLVLLCLFISRSLPLPALRSSVCHPDRQRIRWKESSSRNSIIIINIMPQTNSILSVSPNNTTSSAHILRWKERCVSCKTSTPIYNNRKKMNNHSANLFSFYSFNSNTILTWQNYLLQLSADQLWIVILIWNFNFYLTPIARPNSARVHAKSSNRKGVSEMSYFGGC